MTQEPIGRTFTGDKIRRNAEGHLVATCKLCGTEYRVWEDRCNYCTRCHNDAG